MPQVNITISKEDHEVLVKEAGKRMTTTGKITSVAALAGELLKPAIHNLNGNTPPPIPIEKEPIQDTNPDDKQDKPPKSELADAFDAIDI